METNPPQNNTYRPLWAVFYRYFLMVSMFIPTLTVLTWVHVSWREWGDTYQGMMILWVPIIIFTFILIVFGGTALNTLILSNVSGYLKNYTDTPQNRKFTSIKISSLIISAFHLTVMVLIVWLWINIISYEHQEASRIETESEETISDMKYRNFLRTNGSGIFYRHPSITPTPIK